jgi:site-specific DNA-methyltransferase (adenine-specific)
MSSEDFMSLTLDTWSIPPESARRVGHPAPFPVELPEQLIRLYTYVDDLVLDPFMGSGSTLVAAHRLSRRYVGYDLDPAYAALALTRLAETDLSVDAVPTATATQLAEQALLAAGFSVTRREHRVPKTAVTVTFHCHDRTGQAWFVDVAGANLSHRGGLTATDVVWRTLGRASAVHARHPDIPLLLLTTALPRPRSEARTALDAAGDSLFVDVLDVTDPGATSRLATYVNGHRSRLP